ncbi:hypothetical protein Cgig2_015836 [Carnegiea gigantea]|uniref:Uncharacterized protein n=1 Tax=Carnegiea gigantea TaxID=171969 RepID=A0A9Q1QKD9_9CARY|nr:hypothetical protein Cgig2_015836 [Carnegiea gigantea]
MVQLKARARDGNGVGGDGVVRMFLKGNDKHGYLYVCESDGSKRRTEKVMRTYDDGVVRRRSGRDTDDMVEEGRKGVGVKRAAVSRHGGCIDDHPQTRLIVGGEVIEMSDNDEISVASEDVAEDEAATEGGDESSKGKGVMKGPTLMRAGHLEKLGKKMDKDKQDMMKWKNGVGERIEQKLADTYSKMGCIAAVECYSLIQLVHPMETHDMGIVDAKTGRVVGGDEFDDDYDHCILPPTNGRQPCRPPSKRRECSKCGEVGHTRRTSRNPRADFDANYEGDVVEVVEPHQVAIHKCPRLTDSFALCSYWVVSCEHTPTPVCLLMSEYSVACSPVSGNLKC